MKSPEELKQYVSKQLKRGYPSGELKEELLKQGYTVEIVEKAFAVDRSYSSSDGFGFRSVLLSIGLIVLGISQMNGHAYASSRIVGIETLVVGTVGLMIKLLDLNTKKQ